MELLRRVLAAILGFPLLILGLILIPLPGPGVLTCFVALFILSFGFDWADAYFQKAKAILSKIYREAKERAETIDKK